MKKIFIIFLMAIIPLGVFAQEGSVITSTNPVIKYNDDKPVLTGKLGIPILPKAGDFAIGVDAVPYINFVGSIFSQDGNEIELGDENTIYGKYYLDNNTAIRAEIYTSHVNSTLNNYSVDDAAVYNNFDTTARVDDVLKTKTHGYGIGVGIQKYRGYGRLRGTYGGQVSYYRTNSSSEYTWGNDMTDINATPTSTNWNNNRLPYNPDSRRLKTNGSASNSVGITALAGVEYFLLPKICIGGEVGISMVYNWSGQSNFTYETVQNLSGTPTRLEIDNIVTPGDKGFGINTWQYGAPAGRIYVLFHF